LVQEQARVTTERDNAHKYLLDEIAAKNAELIELGARKDEANTKLDEIKASIEEGLLLLDDTYSHITDIKKEAEVERNKIDEDKALLVKEREDLNKREENLKNRTKDLEVYERRVLKEYEKVFPNKKPNLTSL
jgi:uncharacterized coiled-coil DUF342 family protein